MQAKFIFAAGAIIFLALAMQRLVRDGGKVAPSTRAWLLVGSIFTVVSVWLAIGS